ncbi:MAG: VanZ family protein [Bacteroidales bacterium]
MIRFRWGLMLVCWSLLILFATLYPGNRLQSFSGIAFLFRTDTLVHFILFAVFALLQTAWHRSGKRITSFSNMALVIILSGIIFGCLTELLQSFLPVQRDASWSDFLADIAGVLTGFAAGITLFRKQIGQRN